MLRVIRQSLIATKGPVYASLTLAFVSYGDAFLYPFLPMQAGAIGVPIAWVGVLLSVNRFVRIFSNTLLVRVFRRFGFKSMTLWATVFAILSTAGYGMGFGIAGWLLLRVLWGLCFSALRLSSLGYALDHTSPGFSLGISRGIYELGPLFALVAGPLLLQSWSPATSFLILAFASLPAIYCASQLPDLKQSLPTGTNSLLRFPSTLNQLTLIVSFLVEGMLIVLLGTLLLAADSRLTLTAVTTLVAAYLVFRRLCLLFLSPLAGYMADRWGFNRPFCGSVMFVGLGFLLFLLDQSLLGLTVIFIAYSIHATLAPGSASEGEEDKVQAMAENATWKDVGAALGTLAGGLLLSSDHVESILMIFILLLFAVLFRHLKGVNYVMKKMYLWN